MDNLEAKIEAYLFLYGEPIKIEKLARELGAKEREVRDALQALLLTLGDKKRGLSLIIMDDRAQLTTKPEMKSVLTKLITEELDSPLTPASLETLSIIAYLGPCARSLVDYIRGVNSTFILRSLMVRGLIERRPNPKRANTFLYAVSFDFLKHMGIARAEELPEYEKYRAVLESYLNEGERN